MRLHLGYLGMCASCSWYCSLSIGWGEKKPCLKSAFSEQVWGRGICTTKKMAYLHWLCAFLSCIFTTMPLRVLMHAITLSFSPPAGCVRATTATWTSAMSWHDKACSFPNGWTTPDPFRVCAQREAWCDYSRPVPKAPAGHITPRTAYQKVQLLDYSLERPHVSNTRKRKTPNLPGLSSAPASVKAKSWIIRPQGWSLPHLCGLPLPPIPPPTSSLAGGSCRMWRKATSSTTFTRTRGSLGPGAECVAWL